jgi:hypothetical protein
MISWSAPAGAGGNAKGTACAAVVDVTAPGGVGVTVQKYREQLVKFYDLCVATKAEMEILPILESVSGVDKVFAPVASDGPLRSAARCDRLLKKAREENDNEKTTAAKACYATVDAANGAVESFIRSMTPKNVGTDRAGSEILSPLFDAAGFLNGNDAAKKHLLILSPGFQSGSDEFNLNADGGVTAASAEALAQRATERGFVADLKNVDVEFAGLGVHPVKIDPAYIDGVRTFWTRYMTAAGVPDPGAVFVPIYTAANYDR